MRRFVISDSHGGYRALMQCLEKCEFNIEKDQLIFLGDVVDGWPETMESIDLLLAVKNLVYLLGNHDQMALDYYTGEMYGDSQEIRMWLAQGGTATVESYGKGKYMPVEHLRLLLQAKPYYISDDNILFVHAGFDTKKPIEETEPYYLIWNRDFVKYHYMLYKSDPSFTVRPYKEIFVGHTPTISFNRAQTTPLHMGNITLTDTGAAFTGPLSIMDIDTKEVWQSDPVMTLYPDHPGRNGMSLNKQKELFPKN